MQNQVNVTVNGKLITALKGQKLSDLLNIDKPCGGHGTCGKCKVKVNGREELACRFIIDPDIVVETYEKSEILSETGIKNSGEKTANMCLALDIGTTTLAMALVSLDNKSAVKTITATNPQTAFGADVITRIEYCQKNGVKGLNEALITQINSMIKDLDTDFVDTMYVSGNATMLHLFFGVDCSSIGTAPYTPVFLDIKREKASNLGLQGIKNIVSLPSISSFVGADIVAGLEFIGLPEENKYNLLIDLGTNAEVVLYSSESGVATAAAAGPCFEGANIKCGMSATEGAICEFKLDYGHSTVKTISEKSPRGICGTGLIDIISQLLKNDIIDETGYMEEDYVLADNVYLSPDDVRQYQLAKSAVYSAVCALMKNMGIDFTDISKMYISGGFSSEINVLNAVNSGLLPRELTDKAVTINNSSLQGTVKYACGGADINRFTNMIKYIDLSSDENFSEFFINNMTFN